MLLLEQIGIAALLTVITLVLQCAGVAALIHWLRAVVAGEIHKLQLLSCTVLVMQTAIAVIILHGLAIILWAGVYRWLCFPSWQSACYYSAASYSTVGYGDVVVVGKWRLLGPLESMMGVLMCGITVSLLFALINRLIENETRVQTVSAP